MTSNVAAGKSLLYYKETDFVGAPDSIDHGGTGVIAASTSNWNYLSVAMTTMYSYAWSKVDTADASLSYLNHIEEVCSAQFADLQQLYPAQDQFPLQYLGIDPDAAVLVWLDIDAAQTAPNAVASSALVGGSSQSVTTLSLPGRPAALGFVAPTNGSSVVASCRYGDYDATTGTVAWTGTGTLVVEYQNNAVTLINAGGFPANWVFSDPVLKGDGTWHTTLGGGTPATDTISSLTSDKTVIANNGTDTATLTATVTDGAGQPVAGVTVNWTTSQGNLGASASQTGANGQAITTLTDTGGTGIATVTASITGSLRSVDITLSSQSAGLTLYQTISYGGNSEPLAIENSEQLRNAVSQWAWQSVRLNGEHLFGHTLIADRTAFDFRTYRDSYDVSDNADLTAWYPQLLSSPAVQGTALGGDDVVVRVLLFPADRSQSVVATATQSWPKVTETASVSNGLQTVEGVLVILNKKQGLTTVSLNVGSLDTTTGLVTWQFTSSLTASWNEDKQVPEVRLGADAPSDWTLYPPQATDKTGEYKSILALSASAVTPVIDSLQRDKTSILNNGTDYATLTAVVKDSVTGTVLSGVQVSWTKTLGTLSETTTTTDANGKTSVTLSDTGDTGSSTVTASITGSSQSVDVLITAVAAGAMLYQSMNYGGTSETLATGSSEMLRSPLYQWSWQSVKPGSSHLFGHTLTGDITAFDFRTYRDSYDVTDNPDLTANYPVVAGAAVQGTSLGSDDVVVRVTLVPSDRSQSVVAVAQQSYPGSIVAEYLASVTDGVLTQAGVLVVMNKNQGLRTFPLKVGALDTTTGLVSWQTTTSLIATWNGTSQLPEVILGSDAPADWKLLPPQATDKAGEYKSILALSASAVEPVIDSLTSDKASITNDGTDYATLTAVVKDSVTGTVLSGVQVTWATTLGTLSATTSTTDANGNTSVTLSDTGDTGTANVTATITNSGSSKTIGVNITQAAKAYFITNAPALETLYADSNYRTSNKVVIYGPSGASYEVLCDGSAYFTANDSNKLSDYLPESGYIELDIQDNKVEIVNVSAFSTFGKITGHVQFTEFPFTQPELRAVANSGAPADGISRNSVYYDSNIDTSGSITVTLSGSAVFADTRLQEKVIILPVTGPDDTTFDIINTVPEMVTITCSASTPGTISCQSLFVRL
ncbi:Ig-like domain-containing protein [Enterobacter sp. 22452]|uniref:Ig-like domain-containing protein n=2 Tax=Enterobacter sp. 22452 TaxID=3453920 RepID=UPI003F8665C1